MAVNICKTPPLNREMWTAPSDTVMHWADALISPGLNFSIAMRLFPNPEKLHAPPRTSVIWRKCLRFRLRGYGGAAKALVPFVDGNARVYGSARIYGVHVSGNARVYGNAWIDGSHITLSGNVRVYGDAQLYGCLYLKTGRYYENRVWDGLCRKKPAAGAVTTSRPAGAH